MLWALATNPTNDRNMWLLIAVGAATILYAIFRPSMKKKKDPLARSPNKNSLSQQRNVERQMESLLVELSEMARQITAQLDTRSAKLEALIQEADNRIAQLQQAAVEAPAHGEAIARSNGSSGVRPAGNESAAAESAGSAMQSSAALAATMAVEPMPPNPQHAQVYALADLGTAATDIARQLNRPRGEVELILALRPRSG